MDTEVFTMQMDQYMKDFGKIIWNMEKLYLPLVVELSQFTILLMTNKQTKN